MVSEGPAVSITPVTHRADVIASRLWVAAVSSRTALVVLFELRLSERVRRRIVMLTTVPALVPGIWGETRSNRLCEAKFMRRLLCNQKHMVRFTQCHAVKPCQDSALACGKAG